MYYFNPLFPPYHHAETREDDRICDVVPLLPLTPGDWLKTTVGRVWRMDRYDGYPQPLRDPLLSTLHSLKPVWLVEHVKMS